MQQLNTSGELLKFQMATGANEVGRLYGRSTLRLSSIDGAYDDILYTVEAYYGYAINTPLGKRVVYPYDDGGYHRRKDAIPACADLGNDWRLPELKEIRYTRKWLGETAALRADHFFKDEKYWSITQFTPGVGGYTVHFSNGEETNWLVAKYDVNTRCIRNR